MNLKQELFHKKLLNPLNQSYCNLPKLNLILLNNLIKGLAEREIKTKASLGLYADTVAKKMETHAKTNKPWTDRTGLAKATLHAKVSQPNKNTVRITLSHGVDYGIWLELANGKNYAIIAPTIREEGPRIVEDLEFAYVHTVDGKNICRICSSVSISFTRRNFNCLLF